VPESLLKLLLKHPAPEVVLVFGKQGQVPNGTELNTQFNFGIGTIGTGKEGIRYKVTNFNPDIALPSFSTVSQDKAKDRDQGDRLQQKFNIGIGTNGHRKEKK